MRIRPVHHAILCYAEWCCDNRIPFRTVGTMAADLARNLTEVQRATRDLVAWGLISFRHDEGNQWHVVRLGDGRETVPVAKSRCPVAPATVPLIHKGRGRIRDDIWTPAEVKRAA